MIRERMLAEGFAAEEDFLTPAPAADEDMLLVHERGWIRRLQTGTLGYSEVIRLEIPYSRKMVEAVWLATGGTILAARRALTDGIGFNLGGGFHHAFPGHGEGFCAVNDIAVAIRRLQRDRAIAKAIIVDCDVHHGNGTARIFVEDPTVLTISIHQDNNYPMEKPPSTIDIALADGAGDEEYLGKLREVLGPAVESFHPDLILYVAGADPYREDQLGGLALTIDGIRQRDQMIFDTSLEHQAPVAVTLAGGYAWRVEDTVAIHINTARAAVEAAAGRPAS